MRKRRGEESSGESWLNTYADMVTLLLTFFAVLLSMSSVNEDKFNEFIKSFSSLPQEVVEEIINGDLGTAKDGETADEEDVISAMEKLFQQLSDYNEQSETPGAVGLALADDVIYIRFDSAVFFEPDRYALRAGSEKILSFIGDGLKEFESDIKLVMICGHTATTRRTASNVSDWMLSGERAAVVAMYLEDQRKIDSDKLIVMGYGNNFPVADNETERGRQANRRVELAIIGTESASTFDPYAAMDELYDETTNPASGGAMDVLLPPYAPESSAGATETNPGTVVSPYDDQ